VPSPATHDAAPLIGFAWLALSPTFAASEVFRLPRGKIA
jgi:hypothetical protein